MQAGETVRLQAQGDIALKAAANTYSDASSHSSKGASVGMSFSAQGVSANASASRAKGQGNGQGTAYSNTEVGGRSVAIESGADTYIEKSASAAELAAALRGLLMPSRVCVQSCSPMSYGLVSFPTWSTSGISPSAARASTSAPKRSVT